jgi:Domain of unknown function (DUF802)
MNKHWFTGAFLMGAMAIIWVGAGFLGGNMLALMMTALIAGVYGFGALELLRFRQASADLSKALAALPAELSHLGDWLASVPVALQNPVRLRIEGERIGLPGPTFTPYLVGLLVMLGMLGTFLGMVLTLNGAVFALEGTTDLAAIRSAFAAPIKGLGLAFGTSVAGVASSAMLGLMSALSRRDRMVVAQALDSHVAGSLRVFSLTHQRQETYKALQQQSQALPAVVNQLQLMMTQMERMSQQLNERLLTNQSSFHTEIKATHTELARSVDQSLRDSLGQSAQMAGASLQAVVEAAMTAIAQDAQQMHTRIIDATQTQLDALSTRLSATATTVADTWSSAAARHELANTQLVTGVGQSLSAVTTRFEQGADTLLASVNQAYSSLQTQQAEQDAQRLAQWQSTLNAMASGLQQQWQQAGAQTLAQQEAICATLAQTAQTITQQTQTSADQTLGEISRLASSADDLIRSRIASEEAWAGQHSARMDQLAGVLQAELSALRVQEAERSDAAVARLGELQAALASHLSTLGTALEDPITRLIHTASEAPRAAAEVIEQLRAQVSNSLVQDNAVLEERSRILATLHTLLETIQHTTTDQRAVIDTLVASSAVAMAQAGSQFSQQVDTEAAKLSEISAQVTSSAVEVASLSEAFGFAVGSFQEANDKLIANLQRIEGAMDKSNTRSDEQLAYYVAQAREIIDLSVMSQKEIFEELRQLTRRASVATEEAN